jgi:serine/threonine protein kinase
MEEWPGGERLVVTLDQDGQSLMRSFLTSDARFAWKDGCTPNDTNDRAAEPLVLERPLNSTRNPGTAFVDQCRVDPTMNTFPFSFARKQVRVKLLNEETQLNEVDTLTSIRHPHLVAIIGSYQLRGRLNILMFPAASCNLADLLKAISDELSSSPKSDKLEYLGDKKDLSTEVLGGVLGRPLIQKLEILRRSFYCLCTGLSYLHSMDIRHRAIKPSNILFDTSANVLLTDFGVSATEFGASRSFGPQYRAPELLDHPRRRGEAGDVFSLGCVFLEILSVLLGVDTRPWKAQQNDSTKWTYAKNPDLIASWLQHLKNGAGLVPVLDNQKNNHNESVSQTFQIRGNEALAHNAATDENRSSTISSSIEHAGPEYTATRLSPFAHMTTASEYGYLLRETEMSGADTGNSYTNLRPLQDTKVLALVPIVEQMLDWRPECRPSMNTICAEIQNLSLDTCEDCSPRSAYQWISHPAEYTTALNADNFTDSGYSSASTSSKVDVLFITEEIAIFLLDNAMVRSLLERAFRLETRFEVVAGQLRPLIRRYGRNLEEAAQEALHLTIAQEIIRYAPFIANALVSLYTRDTMTHIEDNDDDESATRQQRVEFLLQTRRELYTQTSQKTTSRTMATFEDSVQKLESVPTQDIPSLQISTPAVEDARSFMATAEAMQSFLASLTRMVHTSPLAAVSYEVRRGLGLNLEDLGGNVSSASCNPSIAREVSFTLDFSISDYLHEEFDMSSGSSPNLRALLVLNGEPDCCYASTCEEYVRRYWPETCEDVLHAMGFDTGKTSRSESQASRRFTLVLHPRTLLT